MSTSPGGGRLPHVVERFDLVVRIPPASVHYAGRRLSVPTAGARLLRRLMVADVVPTDDLIDEVHHNGGAEAVRVNMSRLRAALRIALVPIQILHIRGAGYQLDWSPPLERIPAWVKRVRRKCNPHRDFSNPWNVKRISE